ncbi:hypothetical protein SAMN05880545_1022 [Microbacterium sp. RU33B]|nr:hypothetical protein SAMN05880545_1022 [Microbacterium sp. RU33B]
MDINIHNMRTAAPLLAPIFRSDGQARLLSVVMLEGDEISLADLATRSGVAYPTAHREVARLIAAGILVERLVGRTRMLRANAASPLVPPLREILLIATGPVALLTEELAQIAGIHASFLYGSFAARMRGVDGDSPNDIDVMVIGTPDPELVYDACDRVEESVHRPVNATILTPDELEADSAFMTQVRASPVVPIVGELPWE